MTQKQMILSYMQEYGGISPREAEVQFGCMRLAARIADLRRDGHNIIADRIVSRNKFGKRVSYCQYKVVQDEQ